MRWTLPSRAASDVPDWRCIRHQPKRRGVRDEGYYRGLDLAKQVFSVHEVDEHGRAAWSSVTWRSAVALRWTFASPLPHSPVFLRVATAPAAWSTQEGGAIARHDARLARPRATAVIAFAIAAAAGVGGASARE